jgi:putative membrane protein
MWLLFAAILLGIALGIITGLLPGVHINLVSAILLSLAPAIGAYAPLLLICATITSMSITHTFLDTIPSIFLGAPDDDKALGVLPGHRYLLRGNGMMAIKLAVVGGLIGTLVAILLFVPFSWLIKLAADASKPILFWVMLAIVTFMLLHDKKPILSALVFTLSGILGLVTFRLPLRDPLLPLLSGIFGTATLLYSISEQQQIPIQRDECYTELDYRKACSGSLRGVAAGFLTALLPGISSSSASALTSQGGKLGDHGFMVLLGSIGTASFILSLSAFLAIQKARNGAMAVITQLSEMNGYAVVVLLSSSLIATGIAALLTIAAAKRAAKWLPLMPYTKVCAAVILFVCLLVLLRSGVLGLCVLMTSTAVGLLPAALRTGRAQAMGCLLLPLLVLLW